MEWVISIAGREDAQGITADNMGDAVASFARQQQIPAVAKILVRRENKEHTLSAVRGRIFDGDRIVATYSDLSAPPPGAGGTDMTTVLLYAVAAVIFSVNLFIGANMVPSSYDRQGGELLAATSVWLSGSFQAAILAGLAQGLIYLRRMNRK